MGDLVKSDDPNGFTPIWEAVLRIYLQFRTICEKYGLRHYVIAGTLIGAARHRGFIPWDDDFDVAMPRADYEKLRQIADEELPPNLRFVDRHNTPEFPRLFGKIMECRRSAVEDLENQVGWTLTNGLFIDVFPIDGYPDSRVKALFWRVREAVRKGAYYYVNRDNLKMVTLKARVGMLLGAAFSLFTPRIQGCAMRFDAAERYLRELPFRDDHSSGLGGIMIDRFHFTFRPHLWGCGVEMPFEKISVIAPTRWDEYLRNQYGNYKELPPKEQRVPAHLANGHMPWWLGPTVKNVLH